MLKAHVYLMGNFVKLSKQLSNGNGLWVHCCEDDLLLITVVPLVHESQGVCKNVQHFGLASERLSNQHEPDTKKEEEKDVSMQYHVSYIPYKTVPRTMCVET